MIERLTIPADQLPGRLRALGDIPDVREAFVLSTCNRVEVYAVIDTADRAPDVAAAMVGVLTGPAQLSADDVRESIVVETESEVVRHFLAVTCGLDSMVVGEYQIVAQVREAFRVASKAGTVGPVLDNLVRTALRTSKRARTTTDVGSAGRSMVGVGLEQAAARIGALEAKSALLIGAGRMGALAGSLLRGAGVDTIAVANRTQRRAEELAERIGGTAVALAGLVEAIRAADVVVSSTGAPGYLVTAEQVTVAMRHRPEVPLFLLDLALPRDVDPKAREIANVTVADIDDLGAYLRARSETDDLAAAWSLVDDAAGEFRRWRDRCQLAPVIGALRAVASELAESEVRRLHTRLPQLDSRSQRETAGAVRRAVSKLLHTPTVRVKELATEPGGSRYVEALTALFDLEHADLEHADRDRADLERADLNRADLDRADLEHVDLEHVDPDRADPDRADPVRDVTTSPRATSGGPRSVAVPVPPPAGVGRRALRLGTRRSQLALTQSGWVADRVTTLSSRPVEMVEIVTPGDVSSAPIAALGSTGVFVTALREALLRGEVDLVVHSFKDLPTAPVPGLRLAAVPIRQDPRDALVDRRGRGLLDLPPGSRIGTGSARRAIELDRLGLPVTVVAMRGNVDTRLGKVRSGEVDAVILAAAGLRRLGLEDVITEMIEPKLILPAPAQGALAVECREDDVELGEILADLDDAPSRIAVEAERSFLAAIDAGCSAPVGAYARLIDSTSLSLDVLSARADGTALRLSGQARISQRERLGRELGEAALTSAAEGGR